MKTLNSAFTPLILSLLIFLATACNNDPDSPSVLQLVSSTGQNYVTENRTLAGGTPVITGVYAQVPAADQNLSNFKVKFNHDSTGIRPSVIYLDSTLAPETKSFAMLVSYVPRNQVNKEIWEFIVTDSQGKEYKKTIRLKTTSSNTNKSGIYTYANVLLSRIKNPRTSLDSIGFVGFAFASGTSYPAYALKQPNSHIDLFFNNNGTSKPSLSLNTTKNDSLRLTNLTSPQFDGITSVSGLTSSYSVIDKPYSTIENLQVDQVLAYKTLSNKIGLLRIKTVTRTLDSLIFDVKVEK
ncbi:hypothetical protein AHMF7605_14805 [Adhaeribacter arboris]|uniref:DUF4397 domain-containing protein n=1 Tax=Adhaeribacter arboris TaxID=2072846 RepID=A0A2T2YGN6_9BACT|nr:hypothetical protein [Adhaeribacter arboris]PSR54687.1 hypothetical protein AHMF7605_14805 [Adhaeribacter arboris]